MRSFTKLMLCMWLSGIHGDVVWTPIIPAQEDQVDLWTLTGRGCKCDSIGGHRIPTGDCACCVPRVACPCGSFNLHRCAQCGLQQHCNNMCNMTIDGNLLSVTSGTLEGNLVPPADFGLPFYCWYSLRAPPGRRVEIQLHRLVHVGSALNGTACRGGFVEMSDGDRLEGGGMRKKIPLPENRKGHTSFTICGQDQRLHPPVVLFSDTGVATIIYRVNERHGSPRFMAYYNFPPTGHPITGDKQVGGTRIQYTECDWLYQDITCHNPGLCQLTSPGHPGIYPADSRCKYLFAMSSAATKGTLRFLTLDLPSERCTSDYLALYAGTSTTSPLITTLCGSQARTVTFHGPLVLLEMRSGSYHPPFKFSGFLASVHFSDEAGSQISGPPAEETQDISETGVLRDPTGLNAGDGVKCARVFWSNSTKDGTFDTSSHAYGGYSSIDKLASEPTLRKTCKVRFVGKSDEIVLISLFKYTLGGNACTTSATLYDGVAEGASETLLRQICGPVTREPKDAKGSKFLLPEILTSSSNLLELHLEFGEGTDPERQFITGAFRFHNTLYEGTKKPNSVCDVMFYGASSPLHGRIHHPVSNLLWNIDGPLECNYLFVPTSNQSIHLTITAMNGAVSHENEYSICNTACNIEGCFCLVGPKTSIENVDHLSFVETKSQTEIACFCGTIEGQIPLQIHSSHGVEVTYYVAEYSWLISSFNFSIEYEFMSPFQCGSGYHNKPAGLLVTPPDSVAPSGSHLFITCSWVIERKEDAILLLTVQSPVNGSCNTWNLTLTALEGGTPTRLLGSLCGGHGRGHFQINSPFQAAAINLAQNGRVSGEWLGLISWQSKRTGKLSDVPYGATPKPEHSRTLHTKTSRKGKAVTSTASLHHQLQLLESQIYAEMVIVSVVWIMTNGFYNNLL